jgi:hypothetical protein
MAEWSKAAVLKTVSRQRDVGSNPTPSAIKSLHDFILSTAAHRIKQKGLKKAKTFAPEFCGFYGEMAE